MQKLIEKLIELEREYNEILKAQDPKLQIKQNELLKMIIKIKNNFYSKTESIKSNEVIELRKENNTPIGEYYICFKEGHKIIGNINYYGYHSEEYFGDIEYEIYKEHQGHNYAFQALCLISEYLNENNIDDFWISVDDDNLPSIKIIQKYGAIPIKSYEGVHLYQGSTCKELVESNYHPQNKK